MVHYIYALDSLDFNRFGHMARTLPVDFGFFRFQSARLE